MKIGGIPTQLFTPIPRKLHLIWVGDESKCPHRWIQTWRDMHPSWEFKLWGNAELDSHPWRSRRQIEIFRASGHWEGIADLMRYEILCEHGGVFVDADSHCVRPLDDWLLDTRMFAAWESEQYRPGLIANGYIGSVPQHPALRAMIRVTSRMKEKVWQRDWCKPYLKGLRLCFRYKQVPPWQSVGPVFFTKMVLPFCPDDVTILPSVLFIPQHFEDKEPRQSNLIYAHQEWGTTRKAY